MSRKYRKIKNQYFFSVFTCIIDNTYIGYVGTGTIDVKIKKNQLIGPRGPALICGGDVVAH